MSHTPESAIEDIRKRCAMPFGTELKVDDGDIKVTLPNGNGFLIAGACIRDGLHVYRFNAQMSSRMP